MSKEVILTGLRANNDLTIGNYFGAIMPMIDMATNRSDEYQINLFVPDLHSFTTPIDHTQLQAQIWNNLRLFVAAGLPLTHPDIHIYRQSYIPAHSELTWILDCFAGIGELRRMIQFKEKTKTKLLLDQAVEASHAYEKGLADVSSASNYEELSSAQNLLSEHMSNAVSLLGQVEERQGSYTIGLFNYPVLMAADILLYNSSYVPVGEDQTQHLEFTRDIAERMNARFDGLFTVPKPVKEQHAFFGKDQGLRIKDLQDPTKKMSKSDDSGKGVIFLGDNPAEAAKKVMSAATDSLGSINLDWENQPGISNLLTILALLQNRSLDEVVSEWKGNERYGDFKKAVAEAIQAFLEALQGRLAQVDDVAIQTKLESSEAAMREIANHTLLKAQKAVGLRS